MIMISDTESLENLQTDSDEEKDKHNDGESSRLRVKATPVMPRTTSQQSSRRLGKGSIKYEKTTGMSGGVATQSMVTGANYGIQNMKIKDVDPVKQKAKKILSRTASRITEWSKGMVKTSALEQVLEKLNSGTQWVTIKGSPGEGKTTVAYMALDELHRKGRQVFQVTSPEEFCDVTMIFPQAIVMLDDIFGNLEFDHVEWSRWKPVLHQVLDLTEHQSQMQEPKTKKNIVVILVGRDYVLNSASCDMGRISDFFTQEGYVVNMSKESERSIQERLSIFRSISESAEIEFDDATIDKVWRINCPHGFPHVCRLFLTMLKHNPQITAEEFFRTPLQFLNQTIVKFMRDKVKLFLFKEMIKGAGKVSVRNLGEQENGSAAALVAYDLLGSYLRKEDDHFMFDHQSIYDSVAYNLSKLFPIFVIENCSLMFIHERIRLQPSHDTQTNIPRTESGLVVYLPRSYSQDLAKRFASGISNGNLLHVLPHSSFTDYVFIKEVMSHITLSMAEVVQLTDRNSDENFLSLVASNKSAQLLKYLESQLDISLTQNDIKYVLHGICKYAASDALTYLTETHGTLDINVTYGKTNETPIMIAAETRDSQFVQQIMSLNPNLNARTYWGKAVIHCLCENGLVSAVEQLISTGTDVDIDVKDLLGHPPLYFACMSNQVGVVRLLLDKCAKIDCELVNKACRVGNMTIVTWLFEKARDLFTTHSFHCACRGGHIKVMSFLLDKGASVNETTWGGSTPLHTACDCDKPLVVKWLLEHGAVVDTESKIHFDGDSPLHTAAQAASKECVELLLKAGADVNTENREKLTPLHLAVYSGPETRTVRYLSVPDTAVCETLISFGCDVNKRDREGNTPLHHLCHVNSDTLIYESWESDCRVGSFYADVFRTIATLLVDSGANVHILNREGAPALRGWCKTLVDNKSHLGRKRKSGLSVECLMSDI